MHYLDRHGADLEDLAVVEQVVELMAIGLE